MVVEAEGWRKAEMEWQRGVCQKSRSARPGREASWNSIPCSQDQVGMGRLDLALLGSVLDYLCVEGILWASATSRAFKAAVGYVAHLWTKYSEGIAEHPRVWTEFAGAKRVVIRLCSTQENFDTLLRQLFDEGSRAPTHLWKELHVGVPGDVFEEVEAIDSLEDETAVGGRVEIAASASAMPTTPMATEPVKAAAVARLEVVLDALRRGKLQNIEDLDIYSTDTLAWDEAPDDQILAPFEYATDGVKRVMTDILMALPPRVALRSGLHWGALDLCARVLEANPDLDVDETTPYMDPVLVMWAHSLQFGSRPGHLELLRTILDRKPSVDVDGHGPLTRQTPLCIATYYLEIDCVEALLAAGADPNAGDQPPVLVCCGLYAHDVLARLYLGANGPVFVDEDDFWARRRAGRDQPPLHRDYDAHMRVAPRAFRRLYLLKRLIEHGARLATTYRGDSALHHLNHDLRHYLRKRAELYNCRQHEPDLVDADPFLLHVFDNAIAENIKMSDVLADVLRDAQSPRHAPADDDHDDDPDQHAWRRPVASALPVGHSAPRR